MKVIGYGVRSVAFFSTIVVAPTFRPDNNGRVIDSPAVVPEVPDALYVLRDPNAGAVVVVIAAEVESTVASVVIIFFL